MTGKYRKEDNKLKSYEDIQIEILRRGFGVTLVGFIRNSDDDPTALFISQGIKLLIEEYEDKIKDYFMTSIRKFMNDDFGNLANYMNDMFKGHEYGGYESPLGNTPDTGGIMIHRESNLLGSVIVMYLQFEQ